MECCVRRIAAGFRSLGLEPMKLECIRTVLGVMWLSFGVQVSVDSWQIQGFD